MFTEESWESDLTYIFVAEKINSRRNSITELLNVLLLGVLLMRLSNKLQNMLEILLSNKNGMCTKRKI